MSYLTDNLLMATVSASKINDVVDVVDEAEKLIDHHLIASDKRNKVRAVLDRIKSTQSEDIPQSLKEETNAVVEDATKIVVNDGGSVDIQLNDVQGAEWRDNAIAGCESVIEELTRGIRRWTNQLSAKFNELWTANFYAVDAIKKRLAEIDSEMAALANYELVKETVTIPAPIDKTLLVDYKSLFLKSNIDAVLTSEVNFIFTAVKFWNLETIDFKNRAIKYFGNQAKNPITLLNRQHPRFFSKKSFVDDQDMKYVYYTPPKSFIGGGGIWFCESTHNETDLTEKVRLLDHSGYNVVQSAETNHVPAKEVTIAPLSFKQLEKVFDCVSKIIDISEGLNLKNNDFNLSDKDAKDVLKTVTETQDEALINAFSTLFVHYQLDVSATQSGFIRYLYQLANHLITFISLNLGCYSIKQDV